MSKRILAVISDIHSSPQYVSIFKEIIKSGADIHIFVSPVSNSTFVQNLLENSIPFQEINLSTNSNCIKQLMRIFFYIRKNRIEIVYSSGQWATIVTTIAARLANRKKIIFTRHYSDFHHKRGMKHWIYIDRLIAKLATRIIAVSKNVAVLMTDLEKIDCKKIEVIYNSIDFDTFYTVRNQEKSNETLIIGVVSRLVSLKGINFTIKAFKEFLLIKPNAKLILIGGNSSESHNIFEELASIPSSNVELIEHTANMKNWYSKFDVFVHVPVSRNAEAFGLVYLEALAAGVPCIFTKSGILNEVDIFNDYFIAVDFENYEQIYKSLVSLLVYNFKLELVPENLFEEFSESKMTSRYLDLLIT